MVCRRLLVLIAAGVLLAQGGRAQAPAGAQASPKFTLESEAPVRLSFAGILPIWSGRSVLGVEINNRDQALVYSIDHDGNREEIWLAIPDAGLVRVYSLAGTQDGAIVVSGTAYGSDKGAVFLAWISPDRKQQIVTRVSPYVPDAIATAPDGTIWAVGRLKDEANPQAVTYNIMRHYDRSGQMLGSWTARPKRVLKRLWRGGTVESHLVAAGDRIGWVTNAGEYIEYSPYGVELSRFDGPAGVESDEKRVTGAALSGANELFLSVDRRPRGGVSQVVALDRQTGAWLLALPGLTGREDLAGFDGRSLVLLSAGELGKVRRYKPSSADHAQ
jgi:hypothetical protein